MTISKRLFLGFSIVIFLAVIVGVMGINGMNRLRSESLAVYESQVLGLEYIGKATAAFKQVRVDCRQAVIDSLYDDLRGAVETKERFAQNTAEFRYWLEEGKKIAATDELLRFYTRVLEIFDNEYTPKAEMLIDECINEIPDHTDTFFVNVLLESLANTGKYMEILILGSMDLNTALVEQANYDNNRFTYLFVRIQTILLVLAVAAAIVIALFITKSISAPISESVEVLTKVAKGDFEARVKGKYKGELMLMKNSVNETAAQLSVYLKGKLREEKERGLVAILSIADAGIIIEDENGRITDWNTGAEKILGYTHDEIIGRTAKYFTPAEQHYIINEVQEQLKGGEHATYLEIVRIRKDGKKVDCSASYTPLFDEHGKFNGSVVIFHDVTERKLSEQKIKKFATIMESADAGILTTDENFVIEGWNTGAEQILGYSADEIIGNTSEHYSPESEISKIRDVNQRLRIGERIARTDIIRKHKNGNLVDCSVYYTPYFDRQGCFEGVVAIFHDISERKKMEKDLQEALQMAEEASKVKSTFLANMSHEIRTPMNAVISMTELLLEEKLSPRQHRYLTDIKVSGESLLGIINDILDFSKIEAGKFEITPVHFDFAAMLRNIHSTFDFITREKHLNFIAQTDSNIPTYLFGDDIRIRQILMNLLSNAVKFTPEGNVSMKTRADANFIYFDISDTGIGIDKRNLDKLFDSFQQLDAAANRKKMGTGLGLSITKSLVEMMGGVITVESEPCIGSVFHVSLPRVNGAPDQLKKDRKSNNAALYAPDALVLVVDDYEANLRVAAGLLGLSGIQCDTANSGKSALEMIRQKNYDIVFMDHMMPGMDGVETTKGIREMGYGKEELPIIALTANAISGVKEMLIEQGMNDFLSKPIDRVLLNEMLEKWLPPHRICIREENDTKTVTGDEKGDHLSDFIQGLKDIPEIDVDSAIERMGGIQDLYESTVKITCNMLPENIKKLDEYLVCSLHDFAIEVHGLKGALNNIGCRELGRCAEKLENAAKEENENYCHQNYTEFKNKILKFYENTTLIHDNARKEERENGDDTLLYERLEAVREACEDYDSLTAYDVLSELGRYKFSAEIDILLENAARALENCDYESGLSYILEIENMKCL